MILKSRPHVVTRSLSPVKSFASDTCLYTNTDVTPWGVVLLGTRRAHRTKARGWLSHAWVLPKRQVPSESFLPPNVAFDQLILCRSLYIYSPRKKVSLFGTPMSITSFFRCSVSIGIGWVLKRHDEARLKYDLYMLRIYEHNVNVYISRLPN